MLKASPSLLSPPKVFLQCKKRVSNEQHATHVQLVADRILLSDIRTVTRGNVIDVLHRFETRCGRFFASSSSSLVVAGDAAESPSKSPAAAATEVGGDSILPAPETFLTPSKQTITSSALLVDGSGVKGGAIEESNAASVFSAVDNVIRCAALGSSFLRRVRQIHDTKLPLPPDELATLVVTSLEQMCQRAQLPLEMSTGLLVILRGEQKLLMSMYCAKSAAVLERYAGALTASSPSDSSTDYANVVAAISLMPSPIDFTFLSRYVESVERSDETAKSRKRQREDDEGHHPRGTAANNDDEDGDAGDIIDISPYVTISTRDPYTLQKIVTPVRGRHCCHLQPFDALNFVKAYRKHQMTVDVVGSGPTKRPPSCSSGTLPCPICSKPTALTQLYVDRVLLAALQQVKGPATTLQVQRKSGAVTVSTVDTDARDAQQSSSMKEPLSPTTRDNGVSSSPLPPQQQQQQQQGGMASAQRKSRGITIEGMALFFDDLA